MTVFFKSIFLYTIILFLTSCATQPNKISPTYISPLEYKDFDCDQVASELRRKNRRLNNLYSQLKKTADDDKWQMGVGLVIFWPTLFALEGGDSNEANEYAKIKGEVDALQESAIIKKCELK